jgi:hypothetical protein
LDSRPVFTYLKSRGFYAGVQVDGTVIIERTDENERFYGERIGVADILAGKARHPPYELKMLMETLKAAEGSNDVDISALQALSYEPAPGDFEIQTPSPEAPTFGIPEPDDPDPFGVLALEKEGFEIREAGTKARPPSTQFEFNPSPTSPVYQKYHRQSMDTISSLNNRASYMSNRSFRTNRTSTGRLTPTVEMGTQTDDHITPITSPSQSDDKRIIEEEIDYTKVDLGPYSSQGQDHDSPTATDASRDASREHDRNDHRAADSSYATETEDDEPVVFEAASAQTAVLMPHSIAKGGGLVNIPKRGPPPPLPPRNLARASKVLTVDQSSGQSPIKAEFGASQTSVVSDFEEVDLHGGNRKSEELVKGIVLDDLEKSEPRRSVDEEVDRALEEQHLEKLEKIESSEPETEKFEDAAQEADTKTEAETETETENEHENELENELEFETPGTQHDDVMWTASPYEEKQAPQVTPAVHEEEPAVHEEEPAMHKEELVADDEEPTVHDEEPTDDEEPTVHDEEPTDDEEATVHNEEPTVYDEEPTVHDEESKTHEKEPSVHEEKAVVHEE